MATSSTLSRSLTRFLTSSRKTTSHLQCLRLKTDSRSIATTSGRFQSNDGSKSFKSTPPSNEQRVAGQSKHDLEVGELEGIKFKVEPLKRTGEDASTMRARLLYQSRKRGILESDLLLSTFAATCLGKMSRAQLEQYDRFLDENDWDIYYWATQEPPQDEHAEPATAGADTPKDTVTETWKSGAAKSGEWAQTIGAFKPAYRPVPERWAESDTLAMLREHVRSRSAVGAEKGASRAEGTSGGGLGRMPDVEVYNS